jgi:predicted phage terminase large subunit-like protein
VTVPIYAPTPEQIEIARLVLARKRLLDFVEQSWHVLEPATPFKRNWHIECIAEHLEAMTRGEIKRLIVNVPPGSMKSLLTGVFWPAWEWINNPAQRWLFGSYKETLAMRDSLKTRRLITSDWYQERFGHIYQLSGDQNSKLKFETDKTGARTAAGVLSATGERALRIIWDDPHNIEEAESDIMRQSVIDSWDGTWSERGADPEMSAFLVVMQRLHEGDICGHLTDLGGWEHLVIPQEYEGRKYFETSLGWKDPRENDGDLLWPHHNNADVVWEKKKTLGPYRYAGQHQQRPAPREGGMFQEHWFQKVDAVPAIAHRVRAWDNASTEGDGDYTVGVLMAKSNDGLYYIEDVVRGRWSSTDRDKIKRMTAEKDGAKYGGRVHIWDYQDPGGAGKDAAAASVRNLAGFPVHIELARKNKEVNADAFASQAGAGNVRMLKADWNEAYVTEMIVFPMGKHDDQVDPSALALNKLAPLGTIDIDWDAGIKLNLHLGASGGSSRRDRDSILPGGATVIWEGNDD